ncbi:MAG TPA: hypothetical protein VHI31_02975 [Actinomycetota bacterium]|nr:hypothetical protein [Actinomycetota bacterium]
MTTAAVTSAVLVFVAVAGFVYFRGPSAYPLEDVSLPPGTALPDGLEVAPGSALLGAVIRGPLDYGDSSDTWHALLAVTGSPMEVWRSYLQQFPAAQPSEETWLAGPSCRPGGPDAFACSARASAPLADGRSLTLAAEMKSHPDNPTGTFLIHLTGSSAPAQPTIPATPVATPFSDAVAPRPHAARRPPRPGQLLSPRSFGDRRYEMVGGSRLVAVVDTVGGFSALLKVLPGTNIGRLARTYAEQTTDTPIAPVERNETDGTVTEITRAPSLAGGNSATVHAVDQPGEGSDYIVYTVTEG